MLPIGIGGRAGLPPASQQTQHGSAAPGRPAPAPPAHRRPACAPWADPASGAPVAAVTPESFFRAIPGARALRPAPGARALRPAPGARALRPAPGARGPPRPHPAPRPGAPAYGEHFQGYALRMLPIGIGGRAGLPPASQQTQHGSAAPDPGPPLRLKSGEIGPNDVRYLLGGITPPHGRPGSGPGSARPRRRTSAGSLAWRSHGLRLRTACSRSRCRLPRAPPRSARTRPA